MAAVREDRGRVDRWTPEFGVRAPVNPVAARPRGRGRPCWPCSGVVLAAAGRRGRVVLPARGARHVRADRHDARGSSQRRPVADGRRARPASDERATGADRRPAVPAAAVPTVPGPGRRPRPRASGTGQPRARPARCMRPGPAAAGGARVRVEREGRARRARCRVQLLVACAPETVAEGGRRPSTRRSSTSCPSATRAATASASAGASTRAQARATPQDCAPCPTTSAREAPSPKVMPIASLLP